MYDEKFFSLNVFRGNIIIEIQNVLRKHVPSVACVELLSDSPALEYIEF